MLGGIDEMRRRGAAARMAVEPEALARIEPRRSLPVQAKTRGETRDGGRWTPPLPRAEAPVGRQLFAGLPKPPGQIVVQR